MTADLTAEETGLGRSEDNTVVLVADEVSRYHAKIKLQGEKTVLEDLKSLNGTYVNRQRIVERILSDNDEVWFGGKCRAIFRDDSEALKKQRKHEIDESKMRRVAEIAKEMENVAANMTMMGVRQSAPVNMTMTGDAAPKLNEMELVKMSRAFRRLDALYKASKLISSDFVLSKRMTEMLDLAIDVMGADRGFLMLREEGTENLSLAVAREMGAELGQASSPSMGIARRAAVDGEPVLMADSGANQEFGSRDSIIRLRILSAMCVPLRVEDRILGALYVDSRKVTTQFTEEDLELFQALANQSAMAIENVRLYERMVEAEKKRASLGRFLSPAIVEVIMGNDKDLELGGQTREVTTMFCDIRSFTPMAERMEPQALVSLLNEHFTAMTEIVFQFQGTLDKYIGDCVMALFGAPFSSGKDAVQSIRAGLAMQAKNAELNVRRVGAGLPAFEMGIGINTGDVVAGFIGSPDRMDFTVLGDQVNIASRFCSVAQAGQVVVGESTYEYVKDIVEARAIGTTMLKGKETAVYSYEILRLKA